MIVWSFHKPKYNIVGTCSPYGCALTYTSTLLSHNTHMYSCTGTQIRAAPLPTERKKKTDHVYKEKLPFHNMS